MVKIKSAAPRSQTRTLGLALSEELRKKIDATGMGATEFATMIGMSPSYTSSLLNGSRPWDGTDRKTKEKVAKFLGIPLISVLMLAGIIEPKDFVFDDSIDTSLDNAYGGLKTHPVWGAFCRKEEWNSLPMNTKILVALLYEAATGNEIIKKSRMIQVVEKAKATRKPRGAKPVAPAAKRKPD